MSCASLTTEEARARFSVPPLRKPGQRCRCCWHPRRRDIEDALMGGDRQSHVSARFGVGRMAVQRHAAKCIPALLVIADQARGQARQLEAVALAQSLSAYEGSLMLVAQEARSKGQFGPAVNAIARAAQLRVLRDLRQDNTEAGAGRPSASVIVVSAAHDIDLDALKQIPAAQQP